MGEECSDFVDCRAVLARLAREELVRVRVTRHALERLAERQPDLAGRDVRTLVDVIRNVVRDGRCKATASRLYIWTKSYVLVCCAERDEALVVRTVITREFVDDRLSRALRGGLKPSWKRVLVSYPRGREGVGGSPARRTP